MQPRTYNELLDDLNEKDFIINQLIERNQELMEQQQALEDPERTLLVVSHDEEKNKEWYQALGMMYESAHNNRLAFSQVKDEAGNVKMALCGIAPAGEGGFTLFPLFAVENVPADGVWEFPAPGGGWIKPGQEAETEMALG